MFGEEADAFSHQWGPLKGYVNPPSNLVALDNCGIQCSCMGIYRQLLQSRQSLGIPATGSHVTYLW